MFKISNTKQDIAMFPIQPVDQGRVTILSSFNTGGGLSTFCIAGIMGVILGLRLYLCR